MDASAVRSREDHDLRQGVEGSEAGGAERRDNRADGARGEFLFQGNEIHAAEGIGWDRDALDSDDLAHARMGVVGIGAVGDPLARVRLASDPQGFEVGDGAARREVAEVLPEAEHRRHPGDDLLLHLRGGRAAVERMVVRVDEHCGRIAEDGRRMRRLEHLADISRVAERIVVPEPLSQAIKGGAERVIGDDERGVLLEGTKCVLPCTDRGDALGQPRLQIRHRLFSGSLIGAGSCQSLAVLHCGREWRG